MAAENSRRAGTRGRSGIGGDQPPAGRDRVADRPAQASCHSGWREGRPVGPPRPVLRAPRGDARCRRGAPLHADQGGRPTGQTGTPRSARGRGRGESSPQPGGDDHPATLTLTIEGDRERSPPSHPHRYDGQHNKHKTTILSNPRGRLESGLHTRSATSSMAASDQQVDIVRGAA